jgi:hypothetical protein
MTKNPTERPSKKPKMKAPDGRIAAVKRHKAIAEALFQDIGDECPSYAVRVMVDLAALAILRCEQIKARIMRGDDSATDEQTVRLMNAAARCLATIGLNVKKSSKLKREATDLQAYLAKKAAAAT